MRKKLKTEKAAAKTNALPTIMTGPKRAAKDTPRTNSKQAQVIEMLRKNGGTTISEIMDVTGWQQHSVRGFMSGALKKRLGLAVMSEKTKDDGRTYRIKAA